MQNRSERSSWCMGFYQDVVVAKWPQKTLEKTIRGRSVKNKSSGLI